MSPTPWTQNVVAVVAILALCVSLTTLAIQWRTWRDGGSRISVELFQTIEEGWCMAVSNTGRQKVQILEYWGVTDAIGDGDKRRRPTKEGLPVTLDPGHEYQVWLGGYYAEVRGWSEWRGGKSFAIAVRIGNGKVHCSAWRPVAHSES